MLLLDGVISYHDNWWLLHVTCCIVLYCIAMETEMHVCVDLDCVNLM